MALRVKASREPFEQRPVGAIGTGALGVSLGALGAHRLEVEQVRGALGHKRDPPSTVVRGQVRRVDAIAEVGRTLGPFTAALK